MSKNKSTDIRFGDISGIALKAAEEYAQSQSYKIVCPNCSHEYLAKPGLATCPACLKTVPVELRTNLDS